MISGVFTFQPIPGLSEGRIPEIAAGLLFIAAAAPICVYDLREQRIPNVLSIGGTIMLLLLFILLRPQSIPSRLFGVLLGWVTFLVVRRVTGEKLGLGDVKFSGMMGAALGVRWWIVAVGYASLAGLVIAGVLMAMRKIRRETRIPFAPFLTFGTAAAVITALLAESPGR